ncbi:MAG: 2-C-methyl-D-erythritol 4-phosphate cytidylyltransferase [Lachnospiraceae bacterium]|jgi:2-C-methyl-D-erythritol 4-phosphate cytidylyltransferase|nr:2-C-methyl-D-erythritol 4-phosphate cytidylyltransferase [Lachnospiraceae bacterium]
MSSGITAIILAAGKSRRMNSKVQKQYMLIREKPVLYYSLKAFSESRTDDIVVVTGEDERAWVKKEIVEKYGFDKVRAVVAGGKERHDSTYAGLMACAGSSYVLIHDAARPMIRREVIGRVIEEVVHYQAAAVGVPARDTIKITDSEGYVAETPPREKLWIVQTPQAFSYERICRAYERMFAGEAGQRQITDDAMVMEICGDTKVKMVSGDSLNIKITTEEDIVLAESILKQAEI